MRRKIINRKYLFLLILIAFGFSTATYGGHALFGKKLNFQKKLAHANVFNICKVNCDDKSHNDFGGKIFLHDFVFAIDKTSDQDKQLSLFFKSHILAVNNGKLFVKSSSAGTSANKSKSCKPGLFLLNSSIQV